MKNKLLKTGFAIFATIFVLSCKKSTVIPITPVIPTTGVELSETKLFMNAGETDTLTAKVKPSDATNIGIKWLSSDTTIAKVSSTGIVSGIIPGEATITATIDGTDLSTTCAVVITKLTKYLIKRGSNAIALDSLGNLWVGYVPLSKFDGSTWTSYLPNKIVSAIVTDKNGNVWVGTLDNGLYKFDGSSWTNYPTPNNASINSNAMAIDKQGNIWVGVGGLDIGVLMFNGTSWVTYNESDGLLSNYVSSIAIDNQNNKWFSAAYGVCKYDGTRWTSYTIENINIFSSITTDLKGNIWVATFSNGLYKFNGTNWTNYLDPYKGGLVTATSDKFGNIWLGSHIGLSKFDGKNWVLYPKRMSVLDIAIDANGDKWLATPSGVFKFQN